VSVGAPAGTGGRGVVSVGKIKKSGGCWVGRGLLALAVAAAIFGGLLASTPALAACSTTVPVDGDAVTCVGPAPETNQVGTGAENQVTVNVLSGASITVGADTLGIALGAQSNILNLGAISVGDATGGGGLFGFIVTGMGFTGDSNRVTNSGSITAGDSVGGSLLAGIGFFGDNNVVVNNGPITVGNAVFGQVSGIDASRNFTAGRTSVGNSVINNSSIVVGNGSGNPFAPDATGIAVGNSAQVLNNGSIITGNFSMGIFGCCQNQITNSAGALIQTGDSSYGIVAGDSSNQINNAGQIVVGNGLGFGGFFIPSYGILVSGPNNIVTNTGTIRIGDLAVGMAIGDPFGGGSSLSGNRLTNEVGGLIQGGQGSFGIASGIPFPFVAPPDATLINNGTIVIGDSIPFTNASTGIFAAGPANISNTGNIIVGNGISGTPSYGIFAAEAGSTIQNSGAISVGAFGTGISAGGDLTTINNSGTVVSGADGTGIEVGEPFSGPALGAGATINNFTSIVVGERGVGVNFGHRHTEQLRHDRRWR
jgi:hypothetical protein